MSKSANPSDVTPTNQLFDELYDELKRIARGHMAMQNAQLTLQPTALINEAFVRIKKRQTGDKWADKNHFLRSAAVVMRRVLIDHARSKTREKRGGNSEPIPLTGLEVQEICINDDLLAVHESLLKFEKVSPEKAEFVSLRFFAGLTIKEAAEVLQISQTTAKQWWVFSRAWLHNELNSQ